MDWSLWSQEAVAAVSALNDSWVEKFELRGARYFWNLDDARMRFEVGHRSVEATLCVVGSASNGIFVWGWADEAIPPAATQALGRVRSFGEDNDLPLLTTSELSGGVAQGKECVAIAAKILGSDGVFIDHHGEVTMFFALSNFTDSSVGAVG